jgi:AraC-like DNA-binding protein
MRFHYSTDDLPVDDREPYWREVWSKLVFTVTHDDRPDPGTFRAQVDATIAGRFAVLDVHTGHRTSRRTEREIAQDKREMLYLLRPMRGFHSKIGPTVTNAHECQFAAGDLGIASSEWRFDAEAGGAISFDMLLIPQEVLSPLLAGGRLTRPWVVPRGSPIGSLLGTAFDAAKANLPLLPDELGDAVLHNLCGLVALGCGASDEGQWNGRSSVRAARLERAKQYIEQHLADPDLGPASIAAALGISVGHLHRLFEPTGTSFAQYVRRRRLLKCRDTLASATGLGRSVADIAFGWGFNSLATFYRAFAREFQAPPAAARSASLVDDTRNRFAAAGRRNR